MPSRALPYPSLSTWTVALVGAVAAFSAMSPVEAQELRVTSRASPGSSYDYSSSAGLIGSSGFGTGTTGLGTVSASASDQGDFAGQHYTSGAFAEASWLDGSLHATALSSNSFGDGSAVATMTDTVTFFARGATATTVTTIGLDLDLTGTISAAQNASLLYNFKFFGAGGGGGSVGWNTIYYDSPSDARNYVGYAVSGGAGAPNGFDSFVTLVDTPTDKHVHATFSFTGASREFDLNTGLSIRCTNGTNCDFGHSAHLNFDLPTNVSFTSGSGFLLTGAAVAPVPEPETYLLMLGGVGLVGWVSRRRRARGLAVR